MCTLGACLYVNCYRLKSYAVTAAPKYGKVAIPRHTRKSTNAFPSRHPDARNTSAIFLSPHAVRDNYFFTVRLVHTTVEFQKLYQFSIASNL